MLRKKKSTFDESHLPTDNWIWGNTRGGGGAPLRDQDGNDVANLKKVLTGAVAVDHSPSPKGKGRDHSNFRGDYDDRDSNRGNRRDSNGRGRNSGPYDDNDDDRYPPRDHRSGGGRDGGSDRDRRDRDDRPREKRNSAYRNVNDDQERIIPGLNDRPGRNDPNSPRVHAHHHQTDQFNHRAAGGGGGGSPQKSLAGFGGDNRERDMKLKYDTLCYTSVFGCAGSYGGAVHWVMRTLRQPFPQRVAGLSTVRMLPTGSGCSLTPLSTVLHCLLQEAAGVPGHVEATD